VPGRNFPPRGPLFEPTTSIISFIYPIHAPSPPNQFASRRSSRLQESQKSQESQRLQRPVDQPALPPSRALPFVPNHRPLNWLSWPGLPSPGILDTSYQPNLASGQARSDTEIPGNLLERILLGPALSPYASRVTLLPPSRTLLLTLNLLDLLRPAVPYMYKYW
jgi:hypothetical protein